MNKLVVIFLQQSSVPVQHLLIHPYQFVGLVVGEDEGLDVGTVGEKVGELVGDKEGGGAIDFVGMDGEGEGE